MVILLQVNQCFQGESFRKLVAGDPRLRVGKLLAEVMVVHGKFITSATLLAGGIGLINYFFMNSSKEKEATEPPPPHFEFKE